MSDKVIITCAVTGAGDTVGKHPAIPVTPEQIANSALEAASAGATVVHCHVREPSTGKGSRKVEYYREVMERIRAKNKEVIINLTAGMGGDLVLGPPEKPLPQDKSTDLVGACETQHGEVEADHDESARVHRISSWRASSSRPAWPRARNTRHCTIGVSSCGGIPLLGMSRIRCT